MPGLLDLYNSVSILHHMTEAHFIEYSEQWEKSPFNFNVWLLTSCVNGQLKNITLYKCLFFMEKFV